MNLHLPHFFKIQFSLTAPLTSVSSIAMMDCVPQTRFGSHIRLPRKRGLRLSKSLCSVFLDLYLPRLWWEPSLPPWKKRQFAEPMDRI